MEHTLRPSRSLPLHRLAGAAFMMGNVLFLMNKLNEMSRLFLSRWMPDVISGQDPLLILTGQVALIIGYAGFYQRYASDAGRAGKNALRLFCGGGILLAIGHAGFIDWGAELVPLAIRPYVESLFLIVILGLLSLVIGLMWFGVLNLRLPIMARWRWLPLVTGLMGAFGFFLFSGEEINATFLIFRTLFALGLVGLGLALGLEPDRLAKSETVR